MTFAFRSPKSNPQRWTDCGDSEPVWLLRGGQMIRVSEDGREAFCEKVRTKNGSIVYVASCPASESVVARRDPIEALRRAVAMVEKSCTLPLEVT